MPYKRGEIICFDCGAVFKTVKRDIKIRREDQKGWHYADSKECPNCKIKIITGFNFEITDEPDTIIDKTFPNQFLKE